MELNDTMRSAIYSAIVTPIVLAFLPFLLVWMVLDMAKKMIEEFALWLRMRPQSKIE